MREQQFREQRRHDFAVTGSFINLKEALNKTIRDGQQMRVL